MLVWEFENAKTAKKPRTNMIRQLIGTSFFGDMRLCSLANDGINDLQ